MQQTDSSTPIEAATKQSLQSRFRIFGTRTVRAEMNDIIKDLRGCSLKQAKDTKVLKPSEVAELMRRLS